MASHELRLGDRTLVLDDQDFSVEPLGDGFYLVCDGTRRWRVAVAGPPDDRWVGVEGRVTRVELLAPGRAHSRRRPSAHDMSAPMPATVVKILVQPGAVVKKGETVVMLEAMKMELAVRAARDGIVRAINCAPGELVQAGVNLVELE